MKADAFFTIGTTHKVCQDYAIAEEAAVVLSDGCSSAHNTDFGARLLCQAGRKFLGSKSQAHFFDGSIAKAQYYAQSLDLDIDSLLATLMAVQLTGDRKAYEILIAGDGVLAARHKTEGLFVANFEFESGAPFYLRYNLDINASKLYCQRFSTIVKRTSLIIKPDGTITIPESPELRWDGMKEDRYPGIGGFGRFYHQFGLEAFEFVAIMSDGVKSFYQPKNTGTSLTTDPVPLASILTELLAFKNFTGEFVQRRCIKAFAKFKEQHWFNADDVAVAVLANQ